MFNSLRLDTMTSNRFSPECTGRDFKTKGIETSHMFSYLLSVEFHFRLLARRLETQKDTFFHHRGRNGQGVTVRAVAPVIIGRRAVFRIPRVRHVHLLPIRPPFRPYPNGNPFLTQKTLLSGLPGHRNGQARAKKTSPRPRALLLITFIGSKRLSCIYKMMPKIRGIILPDITHSHNKIRFLRQKDF